MEMRKTLTMLNNQIYMNNNNQLFDIINKLESIVNDLKFNKYNNNVIIQIKNIIMILNNIINENKKNMEEIKLSLQYLGQNMNDIKQEIKDIKYYNQNQNNNQMMMYQMNPIMMLNMNSMGNNYDTNINNKGEIWNIFIAEDGNISLKVNIQISPDKTVKDLINLYKIRTGNFFNPGEKKFIYDARQLNEESKISECLRNYCIIMIV